MQRRILEQVNNAIAQGEFLDTVAIRIRASTGHSYTMRFLRELREKIDIPPVQRGSIARRLNAQKEPLVRPGETNAQAAQRLDVAPRTLELAKERKRQTKPSRSKTETDKIKEQVRLILRERGRDISATQLADELTGKGHPMSRHNARYYKKL